MSILAYNYHTLNISLNHNVRPVIIIYRVFCCFLLSIFQDGIQFNDNQSLPNGHTPIPPVINKMT